jgi:glucose-6-phosphate isomerase
VTLRIDSGPVTPSLAQAFDRLEHARFSDALWSRRTDVWGADSALQKRIADRLGWLDIIYAVPRELPRLHAFAEAIASERYTDIVLLGMGGSSLAAEVFRQVGGVAAGLPRFRVLDTVDPDAVRDALEPAATSLFILASKSGSTIEPNTIAAEAERRLRAAGHAEPGTRFVAITDDQSPLMQHAIEKRFREVFLNPPDIGGRYSALSFFGLVPAVLMGADVPAVLASARTMADACRDEQPASNPGLSLGAAMAAAARDGRDKLTLMMPDRIAAMGLWIEQLVAESTGKRGKGIVPIAGEPPDLIAGDDRFRVEVDVANASELGAEFVRWEIATATAGFLLDVNPFDEPNVQQAKDATRSLLDLYAALRRLPEQEPQASVEGARLRLSAAAQAEISSTGPFSFLGCVRPGDYLTLLAYLPPDDEQFAAVLRDFRKSAGAARRSATMLQYGPRYLHSTGQLHKGGPNTGVFIVVTAPPDSDLDVPGAPYSFAVLELAQAIGDFRSLDDAGRRALHIGLPRRDSALLQRIFARFLA